MYFFIGTDLCNIFLNEGHPAHKDLVLGTCYQFCYRWYLEDADYLSSPTMRENNLSGEALDL